ncbi:MAG: Sigma 54 interacting domain protein [Clostridia bacterium 41_269]|nr:MAG: Sigma 54 interacting domain protein [Clostridia bacterium 41_269]
MKDLKEGKKIANYTEKVLDIKDKMPEGQLDALLSLLVEVMGADKLVLKTSKFGALELLRSESLEERALGLKKIIDRNPTLNTLPRREELPLFINELQDKTAEMIARQRAEKELEQKVLEKLQQRHDQYIEEIRREVLKKSCGPENAQTLKRLAILEKENRKKVNRTILEMLRPSKLQEIVGQERRVKALISKIASPFPQHVLIFGPPGVGKTTAARLALEEAKKLQHSPFSRDAPFIEVNGASLRWDPREATNPLLGSVHDPIYQGARKEFADSGVPEPKLGLVSEANGGILFIDEIGDMDPYFLNKLIKVLEDKRVNFSSSYYDPDDERVPQYIKKLFEEGAPADFILIGATTGEPCELNPASRSRCAEIYFEPLTPEDIKSVVENAALKLGVSLDPEVPHIICKYTVEGRKAVSILADAFSFSLLRSSCSDPNGVTITSEDVYEVVRSSRLVPTAKSLGSSSCEIGKTFGLGISGFMGRVLEIEAAAFEAREPGKGRLHFNETAGPLTKDSVFNAAAVIRQITEKEITDFDIYVNIVGGAGIDGPSAGAAILLAMLSVITKVPTKQSVAITGEISIRGRIKPVGGIIEEIYGAKMSGIKTVLIPSENRADVPVGLNGIQVIPIETIEDIILHACEKNCNF